MNKSQGLGPLGIFIIATISILSFFAGVYILTSIRFQSDLRNFKNVSQRHNLRAPRLPITVPWVGNAPSFLSKKPNRFWTELFSWYPRSLGSISITLGGKSSIVVFDRSAASYLLTDRKLGRGEFTEQVVVNGLGVSQDACDAYTEYKMPYRAGHIPGHVESDKINLEYLLKTDRVNEMTSEFTKHLQDQLTKERSELETDMYSWIRHVMFHASTTALMGSKILEAIPDLEHLFFQYDADMLSLFFGLPKFMVRKQISNRDKATGALIRWHEIVEAETKGHIVDADSAEPWEPNYGSRINRARQSFYRKKGLNVHAQAGLDLGEIFGISSNAIPAAGWMIMHILDSKRTTIVGSAGESNLYDEIMTELHTSQRSDGTIDVPTLVNQPILLSTLHEVLRLYLDVLVSRNIDEDASIPIGDAAAIKDPSSAKASPDSKLSSSSYLAIKAGSLIMLPSWPSHTDPLVWEKAGSNSFPSALKFYPYRFLSNPPSNTTSESTKPRFSTTPYNGAFFPFGGGKTMCPGRTFAKQEILASVAMILLGWDIEVLGYVDKKGKTTDTFPGLEDSLPGSAIMVPRGDLKVRMRRQK